MVYIYLDDLKSLYKNIDIKYSIINSHENFNVDSISNDALSDNSERLNLFHDFEIYNYMNLFKNL